MPLYPHFCTSLALLYIIICLIAGSVPPSQKVQIVSHDHAPHLLNGVVVYTVLHSAQPSHIVYSTSKIKLIITSRQLKVQFM